MTHAAWTLIIIGLAASLFTCVPDNTLSVRIFQLGVTAVARLRFCGMALSRAAIQQPPA